MTLDPIPIFPALGATVIPVIFVPVLFQTPPILFIVVTVVPLIFVTPPTLTSRILPDFVCILATANPIVEPEETEHKGINELVEVESVADVLVVDVPRYP
jgi:hypothetical protein